MLKNREELTIAGVTTNPPDIVADIPYFDVAASEPRDVNGQNPPYTFNTNWNVSTADTALHYPHFYYKYSTFSTQAGGNALWGNRLITISPDRYNYLIHPGFPDPANPRRIGTDDTFYHEVGHMVFQSIPYSNYCHEGGVGMSNFAPEQAELWGGLYSEVTQDLFATLLEYHRYGEGLVSDRYTGGVDYLPDWTYGEGNSGPNPRDMQHPDLPGLDIRKAESLNDYDAKDRGKWNMGVIHKYYYLLANDICDKDRGCSGDANEIENDPCTCVQEEVAGGCDDPGNNYSRTSLDATSTRVYHTRNMASTCALNHAMNGTSGPGYQQYHNGVKVSSIDETHIGGKPGRERLGNYFARFMFQDNLADAFMADEYLAYDIMDAYQEVIIEEAQWNSNQPFTNEMDAHFRSRDAIGIWSQLGNYYQANAEVMSNGMDAAMFNWSDVPLYPWDIGWNMEFLFYSDKQEKTAAIYRTCWNVHNDSDGDYDYCFQNPSGWIEWTIDEIDPDGYYYPSSVPSVDVNKVDPGETNHGVWVVFTRKHIAESHHRICKRQVPVVPNYGQPSPVSCSIHMTQKRPAVGHFIRSDGSSGEMVVYEDPLDNRLKSFEWNSQSELYNLPATAECPANSEFRPETVTHDDHLWLFWVQNTGANDYSRLCYSRYEHQQGSPAWSTPRYIEFDGRITGAGTQERRIAGPPVATTRNGVINLAVKDEESSGGEASWIWTIQLDDRTNGDGQFWKCENREHALNHCSKITGAGKARFEELSPWLPNTLWEASQEEIGAIATTEYLEGMENSGTGYRQDYTFFYNPKYYYSQTPAHWGDMTVWARESW